MTKTMADVLAELDAHRPDHREYEGGWWELACAGCDFAKGQRLSHLDWAPYRAHRAEVFAAALSAAGFGLVADPVVIHVHHDTEAHARSFNEGYEAAVTQGLADDPSLAGDWLDAKLADAKAEAFDQGQKSGMRHVGRLVAAARIGRPDLPGGMSPNPYRAAVRGEG